MKQDEDDTRVGGQPGIDQRGDSRMDTKRCIDCHNQGSAWATSCLFCGSTWGGPIENASIMGRSPIDAAVSGHVEPSPLLLAAQLGKLEANMRLLAATWREMSMDKGCHRQWRDCRTECARELEQVLGPRLSVVAVDPHVGDSSE